MECASLSGCGFFRKYQLSQSSSCKSFISNYCTGEKMSECKRKEYKLNHWCPVKTCKEL